MYFTVNTGTAQPPGSPGPLSMSGLSISSPGSSPQLGSPGHLPIPHHQPQNSHFGFNSGTIGVMGALTGMPSSGGSPGAAIPPPPSPSHVPPCQPPPPLPPRSHRKRESSISESPQQVNCQKKFELFSLQISWFIISCDLYYLSQARQAPNAPILPPRDGTSPPPLPPRRDLPPVTLPPRLPTTLNPSCSALLARRNSTLENTCSSVVHTRRHMSFNGPSPTKLPPTQPNGKNINIRKFIIIVYSCVTSKMLLFNCLSIHLLQSILGSVTPRLPPKPMPGRPPTTMFNFNAPPGSS